MENKQNRKEMIAEYKAKPESGGVFAIKNTHSGKVFLDGVLNLEGSENRFRFSVKTDLCPLHQLKDDWNQYGKDSFEFQVLERLTIKEGQSQREFKEDIKTLKEIWQEKLKDHLY